MLKQIKKLLFLTSFFGLLSISTSRAFNNITSIDSLQYSNQSITNVQLMRPAVITASADQIGTVTLSFVVWQLKSQDGRILLMGFNKNSMNLQKYPLIVKPVGKRVSKSFQFYGDQPKVEEKDSKGNLIRAYSAKVVGTYEELSGGGLPTKVTFIVNLSGSPLPSFTPYPSTTPTPTSE